MGGYDSGQRRTWGIDAVKCSHDMMEESGG